MNLKAIVGVGMLCALSGCATVKPNNYSVPVEINLSLPMGLSKPIIFVYGYGGSKSEFESIANNFDDRPIYYFEYDSTKEYIDVSGNNLAKLIKEFKDVDIIAHSMGGIVSRYALDTLACDYDGKIRLVTIDTPYHGFKSPPINLKGIVKRSWVDMLTNSEVMKNLYTDLPENFEIYQFEASKKDLIRGWNELDTLNKEQLENKINSLKNTKVVLEFEGDHTSILDNLYLIKELEKILRKK